MGDGRIGGESIWPGTFDRSITAGLLTTFSQLGGELKEESLIDDRQRRFAVTCDDCRGIGGTQSGCTTYNGIYWRTLTAVEAEDHYQRGRAEYAAKIAALP